MNFIMAGGLAQWLRAYSLQAYGHEFKFLESNILSKVQAGACLFEAGSTVVCDTWHYKQLPGHIIAKFAKYYTKKVLSYS